RRVPIVGSDGMLVGRELGAATVGLVGMPPAARSMSQLLASFGSKVVGYDPALHASDALWARWNVRPVPLRELLAASDAVCVLLQCFSRYRGLLGERFLPFCKPDQVMVSIAHSALFDEHALADVLAGGRLAGAWLDNVAPGVLEDGRPLARLPSLHVTPRVAGATRESRLRGAWAVARRLDELLMRAPAAPGGFRPSAPGAASDLGAGPASR
ncbi:MAG TPA: NAD(P)-dependent oxidoreductase, partial [Albitalea sp.]